MNNVLSRHVSLASLLHIPAYHDFHSKHPLQVLLGIVYCRILVTGHAHDSRISWCKITIEWRYLRYHFVKMCSHFTQRAGNVTQRKPHVTFHRAFMLFSYRFILLSASQHTASA